ncbi:RNA-directed DNA polymerase from mobile element jockey [Willisornis vidua]|uniref:RNA-directed DNA polymerase from mobile element jockey n=1 Tax=Willisornis vidua TaxID=1566151 RepID=A0ABQ9DS84_9PASS|nr:RNA-directed DNA polymerase from mobile element jockey [Willisornis vidua]
MKSEKKIWWKWRSGFILFDLTEPPKLGAGSLPTHGDDGTHPRILKELADVIVKPFSVIFEQSWESGEVSAKWKLMNGVPIFKKSKKEDPGNYRHVSFTSVSGKVMEKIILGVIEKQLKENAVTASTAP